MTAHMIAKLVQIHYERLNIDEILSEFKGIEKYEYGRISDKWVNKEIENAQYYKWIRAWDLLKTYLRLNFSTFVESELVYRWAKDICEHRIQHLNKSRLGY